MLCSLLLTWGEDYKDLKTMNTTGNTLLDEHIAERAEHVGLRVQDFKTYHDLLHEITALEQRDFYHEKEDMNLTEVDDRGEYDSLDRPW